MPFNIETFKTKGPFAKGALYTNKFQVIFPVPSGMINLVNQLTPGAPGGAPPPGGSVSSANQMLSYACDSINFPATGVQTYEIARYSYGVTERKPIFPTFSPLQCTLICDGKDAVVQKFFHDWMRLICNFRFGSGIGINSSLASNIPMAPYELDYKKNEQGYYEYPVDLQLLVYNQSGDVVRDVFFREAYPISVGDVHFSWGEQNTIVKIPVTFTFMDWGDTTN